MNYFSTLNKATLTTLNSNQSRQKTLSQNLEDVQHHTTRLTGKIKDMPYPERLNKLMLTNLECRNEQGDMIDIFKFIENMYNTDRQKLN